MDDQKPVCDNCGYRHGGAFSCAGLVPSRSPGGWIAGKTEDLVDIEDLINAALRSVARDMVCLGVTGIVSKEQVKGTWQTSDCEQFDHEYVDQQAMFEDDWCGTVYFPLPSGNYMAVGFQS